MTSAATTGELLERLARNDKRRGLIEELNRLKESAGTPSAGRVAIILGQWFHPLHYFPAFLSRLISVAPNVEVQAEIAKILWQELGEGDYRRAHEVIYIDTMVNVGFAAEQVSKAPPLEHTEKLVAGYQQASAGFLSGLGFMYATEVADLAMVSAIGQLVRECTGQHDLPWIDIHVNQEPEHVQSSTQTLLPPFTTKEQQQIVASAEEMWALWTHFFGGIRQAIS
ncbi:MAG TPA: iron-containing redox enzyme family protein [Blastocatellia bacterium]|nr:iron-containing redox enzyme family protein [Blastocatellia bacterium]